MNTTLDKLLNDYTLEGKELNIVKYPDPILKQVATPVEVFDDELKELIKNMLYTMYITPGIGLAAPQVGVSKRFFVIDIDFERKKIPNDNEEEEDQFEYSNFNPRVIINPVFKEKDGEVLYEEGCLSVPGVYENVKRAEHVVVEYQDINGDKQTLEADELLAICLQHENDHLDGKVFLERLSPLKRQMATQKYLKKAKKKR